MRLLLPVLALALLAPARAAEGEPQPRSLPAGAAGVGERRDGGGALGESPPAWSRTNGGLWLHGGGGSGERRPRSPRGWVSMLGPLNLDVTTFAFTPRCSFRARCPLQSPARVAAMRASTRCRSASATRSACTTRAAAATTPPSAKPKVPAPPPPHVPATGLGVPGSVPGHQLWPCSAHTRVRGGMAGLGFSAGVLLRRVFSASSSVPSIACGPAGLGAPKPCVGTPRAPWD